MLVTDTERSALASFEIYERELRSLTDGEVIEKYYRGKSLVGITAGDVRALAGLYRRMCRERMIVREG